MRVVALLLGLARNLWHAEKWLLVGHTIGEVRRPSSLKLSVPEVYTKVAAWHCLLERKKPSLTQIVAFAGPWARPLV